jgi:transcriptional regulator with XRE-family HTH domain
MLAFKEFNIGEHIRKVMKEKGMDGPELARKMKVSSSTVYRLLFNDDPGLSNLKKASVALEHNLLFDIAFTANDKEGYEQMKNEQEKLQNTIKQLETDLKQKDDKIEKLEMEIKYLKEVVNAYKR